MNDRRDLKKPGIQTRQQDRKLNYMQEQKLKRLSQVELARKLTDLHHPSTLISSSYEHQLMLPSEFKDFECDISDCIYIPVRQGTRCLLISSHGKTSSHTVDKAFYSSFKSMLPGGSYASL